MTDTVIPGVGPDAPPTTNERGGKQSYSPYRFDLLDAQAMLRLAAIAGKPQRSMASITGASSASTTTSTVRWCIFMRI